MFKQKILVLLPVLLLCTCSRFFSQIIISPTVGCAPENFTFTAPPGSTSAFWNFGDNTTSPVLNPGKTYNSPGNYSVVCSYTVGGISYTTSIIAAVFNKPTSGFNFTLPSSRCAPMTATFVNTATGPAPIITYNWNFGNGASSQSANPTYSYPSGGVYYPNLNVIDANGCSATFSAGPINVSNPPIPVINTNPSPASSCTAPASFTFNGSGSTSGSPTGGGLTYSWNFQGGSPASSNAANPGGVNYANTGSYQVTLTVTDNNSCSAKTVLNVAVSQPVLSSTIPGTVCPGKTFTINLQTNQAASSWNMPGATVPSTFVFTEPTPVTSFTARYNTPGTYTIQSSYGNFPCAFTQTKVIVVELITASITANPPTFSCGSPFVANYFNASSPNATQFAWSAINCNGVNLTSNVTNPTFTFTQGSQNPYTIHQYCIPAVKLVVTSAIGCTAEATVQLDTLRRPTAWFNKNKKEGCVPLSVKFTDSSEAYLGPFNSVTGYTWNNGAQPPVIVTGVPPTGTTTTFVYNTAGTYTPFLIIQTAQGCIDTSFVDTVRVVNPAPLSFSFSPGTVCAGQTVQVNASSPSPPIQHWHVKSDLGFFSGCVNDPNPVWKFTHVGAHTFTVEAWKNGCPSSTTTPQTIQVNGPMVKTRYTTSCVGDRKTIFFDSHIQDAAVGQINFGDATPPVIFPCTLGASTQFTINHTYSVTGDYTAVITATNGTNGCNPYTYTLLVQVRDVQANIAMSPTVCSGFTTVFDASPSVDVLVGCPDIGYTWYFDNLPPKVTSLTAVTHSWAAAGIHTVILRVKDLNSCVDTVMRTIRVSSVTPMYSIPIRTICLSTGSVQFVNTSLQIPDPVASCDWNFGNNTFSTAIQTTVNPVGHYTAAAFPGKWFKVVLTATNTLGCANSWLDSVLITNPKINLGVSPSPSLCINKTATIACVNNCPVLNPNCPDYIQSYTVNYGDGSPEETSSQPGTLLHIYANPGIYMATITAIDAGGCTKDSVTAINVQSYPLADFKIISPSAQGGNVACLGDNITFSSTATSNPTYNLSYYWTLGNGANIVPIPVVVGTYTGAGIYNVTHTVSTSNGCRDSITKQVTIAFAQANLKLDKDRVCLGESINFSIKDSTGVSGWEWDYGDGTVATFLANPPPGPFSSHTYTYYPTLTNGSTTVTLRYFSSQNVCKYPAIYPITILKAEADFKRNNELALIDSVHCVGQVDQFTSLAGGNYTYNWNFGDGSTSTQQNPSYNYPLPGFYTVALTVTLQPEGCLNKISKTMTVNPLPNAAINLRDTCQGSLFPLKGSSSSNLVSYTWSPQAGVTNPNSLVTTATVATSTTYTLDVTDVNGCKTSVTQSVYIQEPPDNVQWDTSIVIGQHVPINASAGNNMSYTWTPPGDLSCQYCPDPVSTSTNNITYTVTVADNMGCFTTANTYTIRVDPKSSIDVPTAFTPNGDGTNDVIRPDGWGIKKLRYFRVYNRWGQLLFESNDIKNGWDGTYNGVPQNMETYVYQVSAEGYIEGETELLKTGSFKLIR